MQFRVNIVIKDADERDRDEMWAALRDEVFQLSLELEDGEQYTVAAMHPLED